MLTLKLSPEEEARLTVAAERCGVDPGEFARQLLREHLPPLTPGEATRALLRAWREEDETDDPSALEAAETDLEEFKRSVNAERARAGARLLFPER